MSYDRNSIASIEAYGKKLVGFTFRQVLEQSVSDAEERTVLAEQYGNPRRKGGVGNLLEEVYFNYKANSDSRADFHEVGVELKVTPFTINKKGDYRAAERLSITMISNKEPVELDMYQSHLWEKMAKILLVYYHRQEEVVCNLDYFIRFVNLFSPSETDLEVIKKDYEKIVRKVQAGLAHELSESDTMYLAASPKGATAAKSLASQYYNPDVKAKRRGFSFKPSYMNSVLRRMVDQAERERILKDASVLETQSFDDYVLGLLGKYTGWTDRGICSEFGREYTGNKAQWVDLAYRMLGITSNSAEEFVKANVVVKTIRLEANGRMRESISLPTIQFQNLITEDWEDSKLRNYFEETRFLFVIFKSDGTSYRLHGAKFWNMPVSDIDGDLKACWDATVQTVKRGVKFVKTEKGIIQNDLPSSKDNRISHVRPHANKTYYRLKDGTSIGDIKHNGDELPDGQWMTRQSFWLNNSYVLRDIIGDCADT